MRRAFSHWLLRNGTSKSAHGAEGFDFEVAKTIQQIARLVLGGPFSGGVVRSQAFTIASSFTLGSAVVLPANLFEGSRNRRQYDITRDGKRFLASASSSLSESRKQSASRPWWSLRVHRNPQNFQSRNKSC